ncbi:MAG: threonylcarbamoyl-AMP synthase, partial [Erysipelotrichaceae bacterium]|nr:threonylcarbamoyl-AMP synthase [Erysipelotrichaceae bacterium]
METKLYTREDIDLIKDLLLEGKTVAFPTDTVFGLACVYDDEEAVRRVYEAKGRDFSKPLPMMVSTTDMAQEVSIVTREAKRLLEAFAPGAFTIVLKKKDLPDYVTMGKDTIAIRIPDDAWIRDLINRTGKPLLVTSANLSDTGSLQEWKDVSEELNGRIDAIVKGTAPGGTASTIVSVVNGVKILREGPITKEEIEEA